MEQSIEVTSPGLGTPEKCNTPVHIKQEPVGRIKVAPGPYRGPAKLFTQRAQPKNSAHISGLSTLGRPTPVRRNLQRAIRRNALATCACGSSEFESGLQF